MLGGGNFTFHNKVLPGTYINFKSKSKASVEMAERGYVACPLELNWGDVGKIITIENSDLEKRSLELLGYDYTAPEIKPIRELLANAKTLYLFRLNKDGVKASNKFATAKHVGVRGNDIIIKITKLVDSNKYEVLTILDSNVVDIQVVEKSADLKENKYVDFKKVEELEANTGLALTSGTNGSAITGAEYQTFLDAIESYYINTLTTTSNDETIKTLFVNFTKRMRDEVGSKFQTVLYRKEADYEGIVNLQSKVLGTNETYGVLWLAGTLAGCNINKSLTNKKYTGEYEFETLENQTALINGKKAGKLLFHKVNDDVRILSDINSLVSLSKEKNRDFTKNQTIRIIDQIAVDIANLFNSKYLGVMPNDEAGRIELWKDIVLHHSNLQNIRAIEDFKDTDIVIKKGEEKDQVIITDVVVPVNAMEQLYMNVIIG